MIVVVRRVVVVALVVVVVVVVVAAMVVVAAAAVVIKVIIIIIEIIAILVRVVGRGRHTSNGWAMNFYGPFRKFVGSSVDLVVDLVSIQLHLAQHGRGSTSCRRTDFPITNYKHSLPKRVFFDRTDEYKHYVGEMRL